MQAVEPLLDHVIGPPLASADEQDQRVGIAEGVPMLGLDGLSSAAYGPEAALTLLIPLGAAGLHYIGPIMLIILGLLFLLYLSYRQTIAAYPNGGGSYTVAKENLGVQMGLVAAASLLVDYILNVAVGISAGMGALVSAFPSLQPHILELCLVTLALITLVNLRGVRESGVAFALPTYLFVVTLAIVILIGLYKALVSGGHPAALQVPPVPLAATATVSLWLLMRSFASGCTAMTGVEAVSNGVSAFREPRVQTAQRTLTVIIVLLAFLLSGIAYLSITYQIGAVDPMSPEYQSVLSMLVGAVVGRGWFYYVTIGSVLAVLALSANTSYAGFPRLCHLLAYDNFLPHGFMTRGRRLVYTMGIMILTGFAALLLIIFGGITDRLIPLFAVGAFGAFTLSQAGMVVHWKREGKAGTSLLVNGVGAIATGIALVVVLMAKFSEGAWITMVLIPGLVVLFLRTREHYAWVGRKTACGRPIDTTPVAHPIVLVPIKKWTAVSEKALRFGMMMSDEVVAVNVQADDVHSDELAQSWKQFVEDPLLAAGQKVPQLLTLTSPYRFLFRPLYRYIVELRKQHPDRLIAVIIPELIESHWYQYVLHNQRGVGLKAGLFLWGGRQVVVVNVPWYVETPA